MFNTKIRTKEPQERQVRLFCQELAELETGTATPPISGDKNSSSSKGSDWITSLEVIAEPSRNDVLRAKIQISLNVGTGGILEEVGRPQA